MQNDGDDDGDDVCVAVAVSKCSAIFESEILISTVHLIWNSKENMNLEIKNVYSIE